MSQSIIPFFTGMISILIIHFCIKHYLLYLPNTVLINSPKRVRFNERPDIRLIDNILTREEVSEEEQIENNNENENGNLIRKSANLKSELLQFVKDYEKTNDNNDTILLDGDNEDDDLSKFFQINNNDTYDFKGALTCQDDQILDELPQKLDKFSKEPVFTEEEASEPVLSKERWKYANENTMNGGEQGDNIKAFDNFNMNDNFAMFSEN